MIEAKVEVIYRVRCPKEKNPFNKGVMVEGPEIVNRVVDFEKCKTCQYHKNFDLEKMIIYCKEKIEK